MLKKVQHYHYLDTYETKYMNKYFKKVNNEPPSIQNSPFISSFKILFSHIDVYLYTT